MKNEEEVKAMVKHIGIIGEGKMGTNLLYYLVDMDFTLTWICHPLADVEKLRRNFRKRMERSHEAGIFDDARFQSVLGQVMISANLADISSCDLVIETITEDLETKQCLFRQIDIHARPGCILTSNSSSINPSVLVPSETRKAFFAGLHFFYPIALKDIAEIILTDDTSRQAVEEVKAFLHTIRRRYLVLKEKDGFILNRIFLGFQNEAFLLVHQQKASMHQVDRIVRERFFPLGVFEFFDSVGLDVMLASIKNYTREDPGQERFLPLIRRMEDLVAAGKLGSKTGEGFYDGSDPAGNGSPGSEEEIIRRLAGSYAESFRKFSASSGIPPAEIKSAMDEYFGADTPDVP
jgi:3-hydroxyacyl-CoA dehydrogenase